METVTGIPAGLLPNSFWLVSHALPRAAPGPAGPSVLLPRRERSDPRGGRRGALQLWLSLAVLKAGA